MHALLSQETQRLLLFFVLYIVLGIFALFLVERTLVGAFKGLRLALKSELTTDTGKLNLAAMVLVTVFMFVFKFHEIVSEGLRAGETSAGDHVTGPTALLGLFLLGSLVVVSLLERK